jgi:hypothetical protein
MAAKVARPAQPHKQSPGFRYGSARPGCLDHLTVADRLLATQSTCSSNIQILYNIMNFIRA